MWSRLIPSLYLICQKSASVECGGESWEEADERKEPRRIAR